MKQVTALLYGDTEGLFPLTRLSFGATCHPGGMEMGGKFPIIEEVHDKPGPECIQGFHIQRFIPGRDAIRIVFKLRQKHDVRMYMTFITGIIRRHHQLLFIMKMLFEIGV